MSIHHVTHPYSDRMAARGGDDDDARYVVLTVPHAVCPEDAPRAAHLCDFLAPRAAQCVFERSRALEDVAVRALAPLVPTHTPRTVCDLNRRRCWPESDGDGGSARAHPFRERVREVVRERGDRVALVLDVHSYPPRVPDWGDYTLVVLDEDVRVGGGGRWDRPPWSSYAVDFTRFMNRDAGVRTALRAGHDNDIMREMRTQLGRRALLLEFNEALASNERRLNNVCGAIALWFQHLAV